MKAQARPSSLLLYQLCCLICLLTILATLAPASSAYAKTRPEVQMGDPTDTDPGPAPTTIVKAASIESVWNHTPTRLQPTLRLLHIWLRVMFFRYGSL